MAQGTAVYRLRGMLASLPILFALLYSRTDVEHELIVWPLGLAVFVAGVLGRVWSVQHLRYRLKQPMRLTVSGPYGWVRNPIYISNILMFVGLAVLSNVPWAVPITIVWFALLYAAVVREEETRLLDRYADAYAAYVGQVPRWMPRRPSKPETCSREFLAAAIVSESPYLLLVVPFIIKELVLPYLH